MKEEKAEEVLTPTPVTVQTSADNGNGIAPTRVFTSPFLTTDSENRASRKHEARMNSSAKRHGNYVSNWQNKRTTSFVIIWVDED